MCKKQLLSNFKLQLFQIDSEFEQRLFDLSVTLIEPETKQLN